MEQRIISENNVPIYYNINKHLHSVEFALFIKCGAMYEDKSVNGITHFFEHAVFRNINKLTNWELYRELDRNAIQFNASTYKEFMCFTLDCSENATDFAVEIIKMIFSEIILSPSELAVERDVIKSEIYENGERETLSYLADRAIWKNTALAQTVLGTCKALDGITVKKLNNYRKQLFSSGDMFFYVYGNTDEITLKKLERVISGSDITVCESTRKNIAPIPENFRNRANNIITQKGSYTFVKLCFDFDKAEVSHELIDLIYDCLFRGDVCPFLWELKEKRGLIYSFNATLEEYSNIGNINVSFDIQRKIFQRRSS